MKIAEFFAAIGFDIDDRALTEVDKKLKTARATTLKFTAAITAGLYAMDRFAAGSVRAAVALTNFNLQTGLSTQKLQEWQAAAQLSNMATDAAEVASSIQSLQQNLTQIRMGGGNAAPFQLLGIDIKGRDAFDVLESLRTRVKDLPPDLAVNLMGQMGLSPNFINTLKLSRQEFNLLGKELVRSKETTDAIMRIGNAINILKLRMAKFKDDMVARLEPVFLGTIRIIERLGGAISNIFYLFERFPIIGAAAAAGLAALLVPLRSLMFLIRPLTLTLGALFMLLEDLAVYSRGGKSAIGLILPDPKKLEESIKKTQQTIKKGWIEGGAIGGASAAGNIMGQGYINRLTDTLSDPNSFIGDMLRKMNSLFLSPEENQPENYKNMLNKMNAPVFNNNFIISGEGNAGIVDGIINGLQKQLNYSIADTDNGVAW